MANDKGKTKLAAILKAERDGDYTAWRDARIPARVENHRMIQREIVEAAERFVRDAESLAEKLLRVAQQVRDCEQFGDAGYAASDVRSTSLYSDVQQTAEVLSVLSRLEKRAAAEIELDNNSPAKAQAK